MQMIAMPQPNARGIDHLVRTPTPWCSAKNIDMVAKLAVTSRTQPIAVDRVRSPVWAAMSSASNLVSAPLSHAR